MSSNPKGINVVTLKQSWEYKDDDVKSLDEKIHSLSYKMGCSHTTF